MHKVARVFYWTHIRPWRLQNLDLHIAMIQIMLWWTFNQMLTSGILSILAQALMDHWPSVESMLILLSGVKLTVVRLWECMTKMVILFLEASIILMLSLSVLIKLSLESPSKSKDTQLCSVQRPFCHHALKFPFFNIGGFHSHSTFLHLTRKIQITLVGRMKLWDTLGCPHWRSRCYIISCDKGTDQKLWRGTTCPGQLRAAMFCRTEPAPPI